MLTALCDSCTFVRTSSSWWPACWLPQTKHAHPASGKQWRANWTFGQRKKCDFLLFFRGQKASNTRRSTVSMWKVCDFGVMAVQHVRKRRWEFWKSRVSAAEEKRAERSPTPAEHVEDIDAAVRADERVSAAQWNRDWIFHTAQHWTLFTSV
jgi:hypothetical protein